MNYALILFMTVAVLLLFSAMVLSAMASNDASKGGKNCREGGHKYSMWAAIISGVASGIMMIVLVIYIYSSRHELAGVTQGHLANLNSAIGNYAARGQAPVIVQ